MSSIGSRWRKKEKSKGEPPILPSTFSPFSKPRSGSPPLSSSSLSTLAPIKTSSSSSSLTSSRSYNQRSHVPGHIRPVTCTNFLMGGQYYPGKDKKRNILRKKTLWYRCFCSTKMRMLGSIAICAYLVVSFALVPLLDVINDYGHSLASKGGVDVMNNSEEGLEEGGAGERKGQTEQTEQTGQTEQNGVVANEPKPSPVLSDVHETDMATDRKEKNRRGDGDDHDFEQEHDQSDIEEPQPKMEEPEHKPPDPPEVPDDPPEPEVEPEHKPPDPPEVPDDPPEPEVETEHKPPDPPEVPDQIEPDSATKEDGKKNDNKEIDKDETNAQKTPAKNEGEKVQIDKKASVAGLKIKSPELLKQDVELIDKKVDEYRNQPDRIKKRNDILREIVPQFYDAAFPDSPDRYDIDIESNEEKNLQKDGNEKKDPTKDTKTNTIPTSNNNTSTEILRTLQNKRSHHKYSHCPKDGVQHVSVTLVLQTTFDRLNLIQLTCQRWKTNPLIVSVYLTQNEFDNKWNDAQSKFKELCGNDSDGHQRLTFIPYISKSTDERTLEYPINKLRNLALDQVTTSHVLVIDIDLIPSQNLDQAIFDSIDLAKERRADDDGNRGVDPLDAIVVPAFERRILGEHSDCKTIEECQEYLKDETFIPANMTELKKKIMSDECIVFQSKINKDGHSDTETKAWLKSSYDESSSHSLRHIKCFKTLRYEPYVVIPWCALEENEKQIILRRPGPRSPYYDERFLGYGKNKIQHIAHLRRKGYEFMVMPPSGFLTHFPHPISETKKVWNDKKNHDLHSKMDRLYPDYLQELNKAYEVVQVQTKVCQKKRKRKG